MGTMRLHLPLPEVPPLPLLLSAALGFLAFALVLYAGSNPGSTGLLGGFLASTTLLYLIARRRRLNGDRLRNAQLHKHVAQQRSEQSRLAAAWADRGKRPVEKLWLPDEQPEPQPIEVTTPSVLLAGAKPATPPPAAVAVGPLIGRRDQIGEMLHWAKNTARAGDREAAHSVILEVLRVQPDNAEAWLWRAATAADPAESMGCLTRVLEIEPDNHFARQGLTTLRAQHSA
jgi:hypothetical protein